MNSGPTSNAGTPTEQAPTFNEAPLTDVDPRTRAEAEALNLVALLGTYAGNEPAITELLARMLDSKDKQHAQNTITLALALTFSECVTVVDNNNTT